MFFFRRSSSLERSVPLYIAAILALFSALQIVLAGVTVWSRFSSLEVQDIRDRSSQFSLLLARESAGLARLTQSYAEWDDSVDFMKTGDRTYILDNYNAAWMKSQDIDAVLIVDSDGRVLWSSAGSYGIASLNDDGASYRGDPLLFTGSFGTVPADAVHGYATYGTVPMMYTSHPITGDLRNLAPSAVLVFGRLLDDATLAEFSQGSSFRVAFLPASKAMESMVRDPRVEMGVSRKPYAATGESFLGDGRSGSEEMLAVYEEVYSPDGKLLGYWKFRLSRRWITAAWSMTWVLAGIAVLAGVGAYILSSRLMHRLLVSRIRGIRDHLDAFAESLAVNGILEAGRPDELGELVRHVNALTARVQTQTRELDTLAGTDGLTGLANRRRMDSTLGQLMAGFRPTTPGQESRSHSQSGSIACGLIDVDFFKLYNDEYGHGAGDDTLRAIAGTINSGAKRPADLACRYGGEEFVVLMPDTDESGAFHVLERIRKMVLDLAIEHRASAVQPVVSISAGVAAMPALADGTTPQKLLALADAALYAAKKSGRNRVVTASSIAADPTGYPSAGEHQSDGAVTSPG